MAREINYWKLRLVILNIVFVVMFVPIVFGSSCGTYPKINNKQIPRNSYGKGFIQR